MPRGRVVKGQRGALKGEVRPNGGGGSRKGRGRGRGRGKVGGGSGQSVGKFLAPRNARQAGAAANAAAGAEFNPEITDLRQQAKGSRKREQDLGAWYAQLAADYQGAQAEGSTALQSIQDTTSQQLAEAGARSSADLSKLSADDAAFAKLTGGPVDTEGLSKIALAGAAAQRSRVALGVPVAQEQANFVGRLGGDKAAARMQGIEERRAEGRRRDKIKSDITSARKDKGLARVARKEEIREADRGYAMDRANLKLSKQEMRAAERQAAADAAIAQVEAAREARQDSIGNQQAQERIGISRRNAKIAGKNARTSARSQRVTARNTRADNRRAAAEAKKGEGGGRNALATAKSLIRQRGKPIKSDAEWAELEEAVRKEAEVSPTEAAKAVAKLRKARKARSRRSYSERVRRGEVAGPPAPGG